MKGRGWAAEPSPSETAREAESPNRNRPPEPQPGVFLFLTYSPPVTGSSSEAAPANDPESYEFAVETLRRWTLVRRRFFRHRLAAASLFIFVIVAASGFLAHHLAPYGFEEVNIKALGEAPSWAHPFGTDSGGRDYFSLVLYGIGVDIRIALLVGVFGTLIGTFLGAAAGYFGGLFDNLVMRAIDLFLTMPPLVLLLVAASYLHATTLIKVSLLLSAVVWMPMARVVRGACLSLREREFVDAARAMGASDLRIITRHIVPNVSGPIAVAASVMAAGAVVLETTMAFLGFSITNYLTGNSRRGLGEVMLSANREGLLNWWGLFFPGFAVVLIVAPLYFIGDGLRDAFDPTSKRVATLRKRRKRSRLARKLASVVPHPEITLPFDLGAPFRAFGSAVDRALEPVSSWRERRRIRPRGPFRLVVEALVILVVMGGASAAVYAWKVHPTRSPWRVDGTHPQDVSRSPGAQTEVSVAAAPTRSNVLFAASNDTLLRTVRVYTSTDRGTTWSSAPGPSLGSSSCARGDPSVSVAAGGREYVAFTVNHNCVDNDPNPYLVVCSRSGPRGRWSVQRVTRPSAYSWDDRPALAAGPGDRVQVVWTRLISDTRATLVISESRDRGTTWTRPRIVSDLLVFPQLASITIGAHGTVYVAGVDLHFGGVWVARAASARAPFSVREAAELDDSVAATCMLASYQPVPTQSNHCLGPNPTVAVTADRVFVVYAGGTPYSLAGVSVAAFDSHLHLRSRKRIDFRKGKSAQFWPSAAVDGRTGELWACYYDTSGDASMKRAWFVCTRSRDGRTWLRPVRAAEGPSDVAVLWEDARIFGFGDEVGYGGYTGLAVTQAAAHPLWIDTRDLGGRKQEIFTARIARSALAR